MKDTVFGKKFNRTSAQRRSLFRNLVSCLIIHEQIHTTQAKAKALRSIVDRVVSLAKQGDVPSRRTMSAYLPHAGAVRKVFEVLVPRYQERTSGFSRMYRIGVRRGDAAPMVRMELVDKGVYPQEAKSQNPKTKTRKRAEMKNLKESESHEEGR